MHDSFDATSTGIYYLVPYFSIPLILPTNWRDGTHAFIYGRTQTFPFSVGAYKLLFYINGQDARYWSAVYHT